MRDAAWLEISVDSPIRGSFECRSTLECLGAPLLRITRWERSVKTDEGVVKILRCFAGSKVVPPEAPFETDERRRIEKRYGDNVTSYGDWESLRIIRNELNLNRMMAWLFWLKEESARDPSIVQSARNPFRTELLPDSNPIFGVLRPAAHLPALDQIVGFASVFHTIAGLQILRRAPQMPGQGDEVQALMPSDRLAADIEQTVKDFEKNQALRNRTLNDPDLDTKIARSLAVAITCTESRRGARSNSCSWPTSDSCSRKGPALQSS